MSTREIISPSLLARIENLDTSKPTPHQFSLGMSEWTYDDNKENEDFQPPKKKMRKDLSRKIAAKDCFGIAKTTQKVDSASLQNLWEETLGNQKFITTILNAKPYPKDLVS